MEKERTYYCIDMKCFYASVECAERGLDPFETALVVADPDRGKNALCLAISPKMKSLGVKNRCRLGDIPRNVRYMVAKPRMRKYIDYAARIYGIYLRYIDSADIHVYSIDEAFLDVTDYLRVYRVDAETFAKTLLREILREVRIPATAGIGTNLFLAKIALDLTAKHSPDHIGVLDEVRFKETLWDHTPITDFWQISTGTARRLAHYGLYTMRQIAAAPQDLLYKVFGVNAELLIDHAVGVEPCTIADIKAYKGKSKSVSSSQILPRDYTREEAKLVLMEMALEGCEQLLRRHLVTAHVGIYIGYSFGTIPATGGRVRMKETTALFSVVKKYVEELFEEYAATDVPIRRLGISFEDVCDEGHEGYDFFTDPERAEKEKRLERTVLEIKEKMGKNAVLRAMDLEKGATAPERNRMIGGHNAGDGR